ncbi:CheR family methyltransferase, partial [Candidatus Entotheonella palauensis]
MIQGPESWPHGACEPEVSFAPPIGVASLQAIFACLLKEHGIDFAGYKQATMSRRILRRVGLAGLEQVDDYVQTLRASAQERHALVRDLLVRVTQFFRDADAFALLEHEVIPEVVRSASGRQTIRVWVPGCSTGE